MRPPLRHGYNTVVLQHVRILCRLALLLVLAGCASELNTPGEALRLLGGTLEDAYVGEPYQQALRPAGGLRPYSFDVTGGSLPPGLELKDGVIRGTPTALGTFTFTVSVSDGNLASNFLEHRLRVLELPPPALDLVMPETEVRAPFTVRVTVEEARKLLGLSTRLRWDPERFSYVEGSLRSTSDSFALFADTGDDWLQVDLAWLGSSFSGERQLFTFQLVPSEPARPGLAAVTDFVSEGSDTGHFAASQTGARVPEPRRAPPADTEPAPLVQPEQPGDDEAAEPVAVEDDHDSATEQPEEPAAAEPEAEEADGAEDAAGTPVPPEAADDAEDEDEAASEEQESP